jgi:hypothetical protein
MFPYSFGVQAPTKAKAKSDLATQADALAKKHPDQSKKYSLHLKTVQAAAGALIDMLSEDDEATDVAVSAAGHLDAKKNIDEKKDDDVSAASVHVTAHRVPTDPGKHSKPEKSTDTKVAAPPAK